MRRLKILYSTVDHSKYFRRTREFFKNELLKLPDVDVRFIQFGGDIRDIIKQLRFLPDFIYIDDLIKNAPISGLGQVDIPKGMLFGDLQSNQPQFRKFVKKNNIDLIFAHYRSAFHHFFPELADKFIWLPHYAHTELFKDYGLQKTIDYLLMGELDKNLYPLRTRIAMEMAQIKGFVNHPVPQRTNYTPEEEKSAMILETYAREINRAKIFFTDGSRYHYPVFKYYEVTACNTLLLASGSDELRELGFIDGNTFVEIDKNNYYEKAQYYLNNESLRMRIAANGYRMVHEWHRTDIRVRQWVDSIKRRIGYS